MGSSFFANANIYFKTATNHIKQKPEYAILVPYLYTLTFMKHPLEERPQSSERFSGFITEEDTKELLEIHPFIEQELKKDGINPKDIEILYFTNKNGYPDNYGATFNHTLLVCKADFHKAHLVKKNWPVIYDIYPDGKRIETWNNKNWTQKDIDNTRNKIRANLYHEFGHLKNNDSKKQIIANATIPLLNFYSSSYFLNKIGNRIPSKTLLAGVYLANTFQLYATNKMLSLMYSRHLEKRADNNIPNDKELLKAQIKYFDDREKLYPQNQHKLRLAYWWNEDHPTDRSRKEAAVKRLKLLEKK